MPSFESGSFPLGDVGHGGSRDSRFASSKERAMRERRAAPRAQGALASLAAQYATGTVAYLTHLLQPEAANAGIAMGSLNLAFAQTKGDCGF